MDAKTVFLQPGPWTVDGAVLFAHSWVKGSADGVSQKMTPVGENLLKVDIDETHNCILFVRMPNGSENLNWDAKWNQTDDLEIPSDKNCYSITDWGKAEWTSYTGGNTPGGDNGGGTNGGGTNGGGTTPDPDAEGYYYLKGYINDADVNGIEEWNVFEGGMLAYDFSAEHNYVFVIYQVDGAEGVQYMTNTPNDKECPASPATLKAWDQGNKMYVPGGKGTLYLYDNGDATLTLSTSPIEGKTLVGGGKSEGDDQAVENVLMNEKTVKMIENGQIVIIRGGVRYNAVGATL